MAIIFNSVEVQNNPKTNKYIYNAILLATLMCLIGCRSDLSSNQVNDQDIRSQVLTNDKVDYKYIFKTEDQTTTQLTYLGILRTTKGAQYKIMNSVWIWGLNGNRATSRILVFSAGNQYLGNFRITVIDDLPSSIRNNSLEFINIISSDCDPQTTTSLNFNDGIPNEFFRKCQGNSGDIYTFDRE